MPVPSGKCLLLGVKRTWLKCTKTTASGVRMEPAQAVILEDRASATIERSCIRQSFRTHLVVQVVGEVPRAVRAWAALRHTLHEGVAQWPREPLSIVRCSSLGFRAALAGKDRRNSKGVGITRRLMI